MGGSASTLGAAAAAIEKTSDKARLSKDLSDKILTLFFKNADFKDLLSLSSISSCPRYVFTTAEALTTLFQKIKVYPELGPKGEVLYAPIDRVSPGLIKDSAAAKREGSQNTLDRTKIRNQMCMDVAYFYVRTFQIYAALALTVLNTDPVRRRLRQAGPGPGYKPGQFQSGAFVGGTITEKGNPNYNQILKSNFAPFIKLFDNKSDEYLKMTDKTKQIGEFYVKWVNNPKAQSMTLDSFYKIQGVTKMLDVQVRMDRNDTELTMYLNDTKIQVFKSLFSESNDWFFLNETTEVETPLTDTAGVAEFTKKVHEYFSQYAYNKGSIAKGRPVGTSGSYGLTASQGKTSFDGFDAVKKLYEDRYQGKEFPKAYCVARAMILMNPIFAGELSDPKRPYYTDICKSTLDFELAGELMPRPGRQPKANVYFKSLVGLYYDEYVVRGDQVVFTKSPASAEALKRGSALLARLHNITATPESFIESGTEFKGSSLCKTKDNFVYKQSPDGEQLRQALLKEVINPLLAFQEAHNVNVNKFLMNMFITSFDPKTKEEVMKFAPALKEGGRASVNNFGSSAAALLLNYYLRSEALYSKGVMMIETNMSGMQVV